MWGPTVRISGLAVFADAVGLARAQEPRIRALVVGAGPARPWLRRRLPGAVFTGMLSGEPLGVAVASADVMLNPSVTETFGNVALGSMSAGLPTVCADAPAHRALVTAETGLFRPGDDAAAFARAILELAADPRRRRALGEAGRRESARYTWPAALDSVVSVYAEAVVAARRIPRIDPAQSLRRQGVHRLASTQERLP